MNRRGFFASLIAPLIARLFPSSRIAPKPTETAPTLDRISEITIKYIREFGIADNFFARDPFTSMMLWREYDYGKKPHPLRLTTEQRHFDPNRLPA